LPSTEVAFEGLGLLFRQAHDRYQSRIGEIERVGGKEGWMPRGKSLVTVIRDMVREQVQEAIQGLLGAVGGPKKAAKNGRRRRRKRRGPGRPPGSKTRMHRGPGRPPKVEQAAPPQTRTRRRRRRRGPGRPPKQAKAE